MSVCLDIGCGTLCRSGSCMLRCWLWDAVPIWFLYASVLVVERCADFFLYVVFFCHWAGCTFASILCSLRLNFSRGCGSGMGCCGGGVILLRLRGSALLRQGLLSEPEASSAPVSMFLADFRSLISIRRRSPARTAATSPAYGSFHPPHFHPPHKEKDGHPQKRDSRPFLTHHT